jgi:uncharacterized protein (DUF1330 family)
MAAYVIGDIEVTDPASFQEYRNRLGATIEQYGGRLVIRGCRANSKEGDCGRRRVPRIGTCAIHQRRNDCN